MKRLTSNFQSVIYAALIGVIVGYASILFRLLIKFFKTVAFTHILDYLALFFGKYAIIFIPMIGGLIAGPLIFYFASEVKGHGVPEVLDAVHTKGGKIRGRVVFMKSLISSITIGFGGSVGREGPIVQIGSAIGSRIGLLFKVSRKRLKNLVACGAAAGVAATFNAPIAGVFFALEVILKDFTTSFSSIVISSVTASVIARIHLGDVPAFVIPQYNTFTHYEMFFYVLLGLLSAFIALLYVRSIYFFEDIFDSIKIRLGWIKNIIGGLIVGVVGLFFWQIFGVGYETMESALNGNLTLYLMVSLLFLKMFATSITIASGGSGGVFAPALFVGAMFGGALGKTFHSIAPSVVVHPAAYAVVGMGAVFAATAQAPITAVLILFEMTNNYKLILPLMLAVGISTIIFGFFSKQNIYSLKLFRRGVDLDKLVFPDIFELTTVDKAMTHDVITVTPDTTIREVLNLVVKTKHKGYPVISRMGELMGVITIADLENALKQGKKRLDSIIDVYSSDIIVCFPNETLGTALKKLGQKAVGRIPVVSEENDKKLLGLITRKNIIKTYHDKISDYV
jgi:chloride channel protein, CIC family